MVKNYSPSSFLKISILQGLITAISPDIMKKCATDRDCPPAEYCRSGGCSKKPGTFASIKVRDNIAEQLAGEDATAGIPVVNTDDEKGKFRPCTVRTESARTHDGMAIGIKLPFRVLTCFIKFQPAMITKKLMTSGMWQKTVLANLKERTEGPVHGSGNASQKEGVYVAFAIHVELSEIWKAIRYFNRVHSLEKLVVGVNVR
ncbi:hypothetical protein NYO67_8127 [Aspergillus flavus]|nr:hypothetical protein NYO67_8127 [Aspergillus flavus]